MSTDRIKHLRKRMAVFTAILSAILCLSACSGKDDQIEVSGQESAAEELLLNNGSGAAEEAAPPMVGINISEVSLPMSEAGNYMMGLYSLVLGDGGDSQEVFEWIDQLESGRSDGSDLLWDLFNREELEARNLEDRDYILLCYQACLEREPETEQLEYWAGRLAEGERRVFVLYQLLKSDECEEVLASHGIERGSVGAVSNALQKKVASLARNNQGYREAVTGECAAWVSGVYAAAGLEYPGGNAIDYWDWWRGEGSSDMSKVPVGAAVVGSGSMSSAGLTYGHIGIYIGSGLIAHNAGGNVATISTIEEFEDDYCNGNLSSCYYSAYKGKQGILGWVWPMGEDFSG